MDEIIKYRYAHGRIDDLKKGRFDNLTEISSQEGLDALVSQNKSRIIIPTFIGVYQESELKPDSALERQYLQMAELAKGFKEDLLDNHVIAMLHETGEEDSCHQRLIHIGYTSAIENAPLVREFFGSGMKRIGVSPCQNLPDFSLKDTIAIEQYMQRINATLENDVEKDEIKALAKEAYNFLEAQLRTFGLTRVEYAFMNGMWQTANPLPEKRRIITDVDGINPLIEFSQDIIKLLEESKIN